MSSTMYAIYRQTHPPTGVEHCLYCHFYNFGEKNLLVAAASQLQVFRLIPEEEKNPRQNDLNPKLKLECVQSFTLFGNIMCIQSVKLSGSPREAILLSFRDAKLSMVEYDPSTHDLKTLFLHNFEKDEMNRIGHTQHFQVPVIRVDPGGRCAAFLIYARNIAILSFRRDLTIEEMEGGISSGSKPPVASIYALNLNDLGEKIDNIIDIQFLQGYYDPTLLLLYEPVKTWPGRVAVRQDTCAMLALSLNIQQRVNPVIWSMSNLPFDCLQALPVPLPIGGVLIFAVNSLLYLNQSVPPFGVSLNSFTSFSTAFPLKPQEGVKISLDCAQACFISYDKLVISLKGGELYVLTLFNDGMRSVRSFNFDKAAASVLTTCMSVCEEGYLFLGSRLGNSLLLRYTEKQIDSVVDERRPEEFSTDITSRDGPPFKKKKYDNLGDWMATDVALIEDPDELEVYGTEKQTLKEITVHTFEVCDSLLNIGPCGKICMGEPAFLSEEFANNPDPDIELVTTSGHGKNGALCILQRSVRPQVVTTFELPGCVDMWTVVGPSSEKKDDAQEKTNVADVSDMASPDADADQEENNTQNQEETLDLSNSHAFLILSRADSTMVLQTGQEINELDHSGFSTQAPTVFAGNMGNNRYIVQVSPMGIRLLEGTRPLQHIPLDVGAPIVFASLADPYLIILSQEGLVIQLVLRQDATGMTARFGISRPQLSAGKATINTLCIYKDLSGLFTTIARKETFEDYETHLSPIKQPKSERSFALPGDNVDDEDELLYGDSGLPPAEKEPQPIMKETKISRPKNVFEIKEVKPTYWLFISRENGILEIYSLPDYRMSYLVKNFPMGQKVLVDSIQMTISSSVLSSADRKSEKAHESMPTVQEMLVVGLGPRQTRPLLLVRVEDDLLIYEAFPFYETQTDNHLKLRFRKLPCNLMVRERLVPKGNKDASQSQSEQSKPEPYQRWLRCFQDVSGYSGVFVCGPYPHWLFMTSRGELRTHPMGIDGSVTSFAPFHNVNCPKGFLYFNKQGALRISILPTHLTYDAPWPVRKVPLRSTPHFVNYHLESKTYCVVTSTTEPCNRLVRFTGDEKEYEVLERDDRYIYPVMDKFVLQLFSPVSWEMIPNTRIELEEWEHMTCLKNVMLASEGTRSGLKGYLALGTSYSYGEDVTSRGRILILDIIDVVPEPGQPLTKNKFKILYSKEQKGPVTALCQVVGFLLTAIGQKIYIWQLKNNDLVGVAFIDTQIYIHSAISIKNLILVADIYKSISLLQYQEDSRTLSLVSKDIRPLEVYGTEFLIDNNQLAFVVSDVEKNIILYTYQPEARESCGGQRLLRRGDIHIGSHISSFFRIRCRVGDVVADNRLTSAVQKRHITMFATLDGSLGYLLPIPEKTYRRLLMLQNVLINGIPHIGGLNPKGFRMHKSQRKYLMNPHKNILDGDLLWKYLGLSTTERLEMARRIGTVSEQILDDLMEIDSFTSHF